MLTRHGNGNQAGAARDDAAFGTCAWFDLLDPSEDERQSVEQAIGARLPERSDIGGLELSDRLVRESDSLRLNVPYFTSEDDVAPTPLGLVLTPDHLVSLRYAPSAAFEQAGATLDGTATTTSAGAFATLVEAIVGDTADHMEDTAANVGTLSARLFGKRHHQDGTLRAMLSEVGRVEARLTRLRLTSTGVLRVVMFAHENAVAWIAPAEMGRLHAAQKDLGVLGELDAQLTDKLQFLLDAVLGFINIEQNDVMKVFTVASVAAIPPVILVGIWGMNFQHMPELRWPYGYPLALGVIALSMVVPLLWFRRRGWI